MDEVYQGYLFRDPAGPDDDSGGLGAQKTVLVHNVDEMTESLADNTEIVLAPGEYNLSNWQEKEFSERLLHCFDYYDSAPAGLYLGDGCTLDIAGFKDLTIRGLDTETITAEIVTEFPIRRY